MLIETFKIFCILFIYFVIFLLVHLSGPSFIRSVVFNLFIIILENVFGAITVGYNHCNVWPTVEKILQRVGLGNEVKGKP